MVLLFERSLNNGGDRRMVYRPGQSEKASHTTFCWQDKRCQDLFGETAAVTENVPENVAVR